MKLPKKITDRAEKLKNYTNAITATQAFRVKIKVGDRYSVVHFNKHDGVVKNLQFSGELESPWCEMLDLFLEFLEDKNIAEIQKISVRELDYFFRDSPSVAVFDYYPDEFFQLLELPKYLTFENTQPESIKKPFYNFADYGSFNELPYGMQMEIVEEFFSEYKKFHCELYDIVANRVEISILSEKSTVELLEDLKFHFGYDVSFKLILKK